MAKDSVIHNHATDTFIRYERGGEELILHTQDHPDKVQRILQRNNELGQLKQYGRGMKMAASVPAAIHLRWMREFNATYKGRMSRSDFLKRKLNNHNTSRFRVWSGKV